MENSKLKHNNITKQQYKRWFICSIKRGAWAPITVFVIHMIAIFIFNIYKYYPSFDIPMHFIGGMAITFFFIESVICAYDAELLGKITALAMILIMFLLTCTTTIFWEFAEWLVEKIFLIHTQVSLDDTLLDMFLGICGGMIMIVIRFKYILEEPNRKE